ncbi:hypothetical protein ACFYQQ_11785 [Streptomyces sp. NPDC005496]|uniref:hypothetical protein n=1 Tax=Streptomyces sp. NPDC005496 TaxID=3364716 RepID=UPI003688DB9B
MGERQSDGRHPAGRAVPPVAARPGAGTSPSAGADAESLVEALLTAVRDHPVDPRGEKSAVAAFLAARKQGAHGAPARRRDDWRTWEQRRGRRSLRAALAALFAGLALGGVAVAAIGSGGLSPGGDEDRDRTRPSSAPADHSGVQPGATGAPGGTSPSSRPPAAADTEAHCRAYEAVGGRGKSLGSTAWRRLIAEAGGAERVEAYCAGRPASASARAGKPGKGAGSGRPIPSAEATRPTRPADPTRPTEPTRTVPAAPGASKGNGRSE